MASTDLVDKLRQGSTRAAGRLISMVENGDEAAKPLLAELDRFTGHAYVIGITGPPGAGKSSLVFALAELLRTSNCTVGIIAVDPTSPFTGGAFLGDRIRMMGLALDAGVFIRSMGSRGNLGGLAATTSDAINILDAMGKDFIIVETVGSGQSEVDIIKYAHTVLVITVPGAGDQIQTLKAGILEIADILVVNKADKEGADQVMLELETMLDLNPRRCHLEWVPPVVKTSTTEQEGLKDLYEAIMKHRRFLVSSGRFEEKQKTRRHNEFIEHVMNRLREEMQRRLAEGAQFNEILEQVINRETDLHAAAEYVINALRL